MSDQARVPRVFEQAVAEHRAGRAAEAARLYREVLRCDPKHEQARFLVAALALEAGGLDEAHALLSALLKEQPQNAVYWSNLGETLRRQNNLEQAASALARAVALKPDLAPAHFNLGIVTQELGETTLSRQAFERAVELKPDDARLQRAFAAALVRGAHYERAIGHFQCALLGQPSASLYCEYAACLRNAGRLEAALHAAERAVELEPKSALALHERSAVLVELARFDDAIGSSELALRIEPRSAALHTGLAAALVEVGRLDEGLNAYRAAVSLDERDYLAHSNLVFLLAFQPGVSAQMLLDEARRWAERHAQPLRRSVRDHDNERAPERRLRIGYVSSNFNRHCQALFTLPLLEHHDRRSFELFAYASQLRSDEVTTELVRQFDHWHDISRLTPAAAADLIRGHRIDILVDLTMHMSVTQLLIFAQKPAPIQIAWLAYPGTTGLSSMDYRVTDRHLDPPDQLAQPYAEQSLVMPDTFWCYRAGDAPEVAPLPALGRGYVTFGSLNSFWKLNTATLLLWARVLAELPNSRLLLLAPPGSARARVGATFASAGVAAERLQFADRRPRSDYLKLYREIDVCLDTLPYNGHTTSLDAFYMGVPVVSLVGDTVVGRAGLCHARNLGLPELVADTPDSFVEAAHRLATDLPALAQLRAELRERLQKSPLMDAPRFAANLEAKYREAWRQWCQVAQ